MAEKGLESLFLDTLRDVYYAEKQILKNLPKLEAAAVSDELKEAFNHHTTETEGQIQRLEKVFDLFGRAARGKHCDGIEGILKEGESVMEEFAGSSALDAGLISSAQAVEHYEITRYGTLRRWAGMLSVTEAVDLLSETLEQETRTDELLTTIAEAEANAKAKSQPKS